MRLNQKLSRVEIESFEISDKLVFRYFDSLPESEREAALLRAIRIGVLAQMEDRFSSFLAKTTDDLGVRLENLKLLFDMKQEVFHKTAIKGVAAENDILAFLETYIEQYPQDSNGRILLARVLSLSGNDIKAKEELESVLKQQPDNLYARLALSSLYEKAEDDADALREINEALFYYPQTPAAQQRFEKITKKQAQTARVRK